jgi:hypothetical protein
MPKPTKPVKIDIVCDNCGSHEIVQDAIAVWSFEKQEYLLDCVTGQWWCNDCGAEGDRGPKELKVEAPF